MVVIVCEDCFGDKCLVGYVIEIVFGVVDLVGLWV